MGTTLQQLWLKLVDVIFFWAHALIAALCAFGWLIPGGERLHLVVILGIAFSWYVLGLWHGIGYCILTDWQWRVRQRLGMTPEHGSFVQLLLERASGMHLNANQVKMFAYGVFWVSAFISVYINFIAAHD